MLKRIFLFSLFLAPFSALASGYTWFSGLEHSFHVKEHILTFGFVAVFLVILGAIYRLQLVRAENPLIPDNGNSFRNFFEGFGEAIYGLATSIMGEEQTKRYFPAIVTLFLFIFLSNSIGLIPGFLPPTSNLNTTLALGLFVFIYYNFHGVKVQGIVGHIKHFMGPVWYLAPLIFIIEIISHAVRPLSLALRLRGNMEGDHLVLSIFSDLVPLFIPIIFLVIGLFVCFMQAFVFTLLTMVYISLATEHHDHDEHH
ncbi:MAG: F0F1 ATP synthase subunit A [Halobacteriovoraceae bacterium]|nr:F0F1 ATP synthase subunit A [Halobacteriovoraceae bacterium]